MAKTRVLVVEDSLTMRKHLIEVLGADPSLEVVGEAEDGKSAIELCKALRPDVITLDMMLPVVTGVAVTEYVMAFCPTPILIVSASTNRGELYRMYDALAAGAVDVLEKPCGNEPDEDWERTLISSVKMVARIKVITHLRGKLGTRAQSGPDSRAPFETWNGSGNDCKHSRIVAIGASTGGPAALVTILRKLPPAFPAPILLVIHIGHPFGAAFAEWLDAQTRLPVRYAKDREPVPVYGQSGVVMAPPGLHLMIESGRLRLTSDPERNSCRPSVDVLFESLARELGHATTACLLTGMGRDGAAGLLALQRAGALTFAQDERSCVVFGMSREAIEMGAASHVLDLDGIALALAAIVQRAELRGQQ
jgi:two-component system, chemotaxis family, protein-glutamate methylesterase/glutaminase